MRRPVVTISGSTGRNLIPGWGPALVSVTLVDNDGGESDTLTIVFAVSAPFPPAPAKSTLYACAYGWDDGALRDAGLFTVQNTSISGDAGSGYLLTVTCRAADFIDKMKDSASGHFEETTAGDIFQKIASDAGISATVDPDIAGTQIPYRLRWSQSAVGFATELAGDLGGVLKLAGGKMLVAKRNSGKTASGTEMPPIPIDFSETGPIELTVEGRPEYKESASSWFDPLEGIIKSAEASSIGTAARMMALHPFPTEAEAKKGGEALASEQARGSVTGSIEIEGRIDAMAGAPVELTGFGSDYDGLALVAPTITNTFTFDESGGWITTVEIENRKES